MKLFYGERIEGCRIAERGVFTSIEEFVPYRKLGWSGTHATDEAADAIIKTMPRDALTILGEVLKENGE